MKMSSRADMSSLLMSHLAGIRWIEAGRRRMDRGEAWLRLILGPWPKNRQTCSLFEKRKLLTLLPCSPSFLFSLSEEGFLSEVTYTVSN